ncbi:PREDICTED: protein FAR1-RELATED SEQUENCE 5-like [Fragaria vesca subsp. vesca]
MEKSMGESNNSLERSKEDLKPKYYMEFDSEIAAFNFYNAYARSEGFSIRRDGHGKDEKCVLTSRTFVCCKEGFRKEDKSDDLTKNPRAQTRTACGAIMGIKLVRHTGKYCVYRFSEEHNHPLVKQDCVQWLPSHRNVTSADSAFIDLTANSGVPQKPAFELMGQQAGGRESLSFTRQDQKNYLQTVQQRKMKFGEASYLMEYFSKQMLENPSFFYEKQLDSEDQITNIFWADAKMIMDYGIFGDVVSFDTTYKLNEANRPFAIFVGLNNHRETVIFGAALMYDETAASFIWLFETFLKAMCGKPPQTFFTDQDVTIAKVVLHVMPDTYHQLCIWHLMQNAAKKVGFLFRNSNGDEKEGNIFNKLLYQIEEENEFLSAWESMLDEYNAHDNTWLAATFAIRKKWVHAYVKWTWSAGMHST